jgi:hypothetical protein
MRVTIMGRATDGPVWRWRNLANIPAPAVTGPMLHGLNLGLVAVWIQHERRKRSRQLDRAEELALMLAEGSLDVAPDERTGWESDG